VSTTTVGALVFYGLAALAVAGAAWVALAPNIVHSAFALLATFLGVAGLYAWLSADLVAVIQLLVYVGGVLVLILFAVMLTSRISDVKVSNRSLGLVPGAAVLLAVGTLLLLIAIRIPWKRYTAHGDAVSASDIGDALLDRFVLPFEVISILLLAALVGAVVIARGRRAPPPIPDPEPRPRRDSAPTAPSTPRPEEPR
jgi:NADH-quinone oxidoreductase subunit J